MSAGSAVIEIRHAVPGAPGLTLRADTLAGLAAPSPWRAQRPAGSTVMIIRVCIDTVPLAQGLTRRALALAGRAGLSCRTYGSAGSTVLIIRVYVDAGSTTLCLTRWALTVTPRAGRSCRTHRSAGSTVRIIRVYVDTVPLAQDLARRADTLAGRAGRSCRACISAGPAVMIIRVYGDARTAAADLAVQTYCRTPGNRGPNHGIPRCGRQSYLVGGGPDRDQRVLDQAHLAAGRVQQVRVITELRDKYYRKDHDSNSNHRVEDLLIRTYGGCSGTSP
jgi:hypothetical protein